MIKWYLYIDFGSGYTLITPYDLSTTISWDVDENINQFVKRKSFNGSFKLYGSEAQTAFTYFITNGNDSAPFRVYENGISGVGTLEYQGFVNIKADYNNRETLVTFNSFKTEDDYEPVLSVWKDDSTIVESLSFSGGFRRFFVQGQNTNCNKIQGYVNSGGTYVTSGTPLSLSIQGRVAACKFGVSVAVYDNISKEVRTYVASGGTWVLSTFGTSWFADTQAGNGALTSISATQLIFIDDYRNDLYLLTGTTGTFTITNQTNIESVKYPSLAYMSNSARVALVDNNTKTLKTLVPSTGVQIGQSLSLGDIDKGRICKLDGANDRIAFVDSKSNMLRCYAWSGTTWAELGTPINIGSGSEIEVGYVTTNTIAVMDVISGYLKRYTFSGTAWTLTGTQTISGGYMGACAYGFTSLAVIQSDSYALATSRCGSYFELTNAVLSDLGLLLSIPSTGHGATFDLDDIYFGEMNNITDIDSDSAKNPVNYYRFKLKELLDFPVMFQNYWYIDGSSIKFTQPDLFSSIGTNFSIDTLQRAGLYVKTENDQLTYKEGFNISKEKLLFPNEMGGEFTGLPIDYSRDNENEIIYNFPYTTDFDFIVDYMTGQAEGLNKSGLFICHVTSNSTIDSNTGVINGSDTRNNYLSKSQIMEDFWKDYRYSNEKNFDLNGNSVAPQDTVKDIIRYTTLELDYDDLSLTSFPASVGSLTWDSGTKVGYIYRFAVDMDARKIIIDTGLLDL